MTALALFRRRFHDEPAGSWSAPGRANLIGEHTDYTGGLVLPFAIDSRAQVAVSASPSQAFQVVSAQRKGQVVTFAEQDIAPGAAASRGWYGYALGVAWALKERGAAVPPLRIAVDSAVPAGAGLSSSAAVECAVALAVSDFLGLDLDRPTIARIAQRAENAFVGVPCGLMDQMASAASIAGHALFFDIGADTIEHIPFDTAAAGLVTLVIDTRVHHSLADGEYARRRADTEAAAAQLGLELLSQLGFADLDAALGRLTGPDAAVLRKRVRHVITENQRVRETVALLRAGRIPEIGVQLSASHASLRDDYEVSCAELDLAARVAEEAGALGARMVGGGFGGSVIALAPATSARAVTGGVIDAFQAAGFAAPTVRSVTPAAGARRDL